VEPEDEGKLAEAMAKIAEHIETEHPELAAIMEQAKSCEVSVDEAFSRMAKVLHENPDMGAAIDAVARKHTASLKKEGELLAPETLDGPGYLFDSGVGLPRMNPLYEAALIERLQYDGDIPEARTGPLPPGVRPAIPVETRARNPVAIGHLLESASEQVTEEARVARLEHVEKVKTLTEKMEADGTALVPVEEGGTDIALMLRGDADSDPECYRRGEVPAPIKTERISGAELALAQDAPDVGAYAFKAIATTQGRRSAERTIWEGIVGRLEHSGLEVHEWGIKATGEELVKAAWVVDIAGPNATQARFAPVDVAIGALASKILRDDRVQDLAKPVYLEVEALNTVDLGSVGWTARLVG